VAECQTGYFITSYKSSIDDSEQPFAFWVPRTYSPKRKYPLLVALHGSDADHRMIPEECFRIHERGFREDLVLLCPFGRGDLNFSGPGEADIWDAMRWVRERYAIDARRQYLTGLSMGGFATWRLGCGYPDQWAAIAPVCGGADVASARALSSVPVWCVHGVRDDLVPINRSREMVAALRLRNFRVRFSQLRAWGHDSWRWLYDPNRRRDSLPDWLFQYRRRTPAAIVQAPKPTGSFRDLFSSRVIISFPVHGLGHKETQILRAEAERLAAYSFGEYVMRSGRLLVKPDVDLNPADLASANQVMLGRIDNHCVLRRISRKLVARHLRGRLQVRGTEFLGKTLIVVAVQANSWNPAKKLGIITYQQFHQMQGIMDGLFGGAAEMGGMNIYDTLQHRFILREPIVES
jgi:pimeloyl-ACP methyl ester carboxylesterase